MRLLRSSFLISGLEGVEVRFVVLDPELVVLLHVGLDGLEAEDEGVLADLTSVVDQPGVLQCSVDFAVLGGEDFN